MLHEEGVGYMWQKLLHFCCLPYDQFIPLILYFDFFSGFSPASTLSAPILALVLAQPRFCLPPLAQLVANAAQTSINA
jgi:hypothetical protein